MSKNNNSFKEYSKEGIVKYLNEVKISLQNDVAPAIDLYMKHFFKTNEGVGFFAIPRMIFPEIDNLGSYYCGEINNTAQNAIKFIKDYFVTANSEYKNKGALVYLIYRHGLMHQHTPKYISYKGKNIGWAIHLSSNGVVTGSTHLKLLGKTLMIDGRQLYLDLLTALDSYINDINSDKPNLIQNFTKSFNVMQKPLSKALILRKHKSYIKDSDFKFLK